MHWPCDRKQHGMDPGMGKSQWDWSQESKVVPGVFGAGDGCIHH